METTIKKRIPSVLNELLADAKNDYLRMMKGAAKSIFGSFKPEHFKDAYLAISKEQGEDLREYIIKNDIKNIVEFGTSFGISTLYLAEGALETGGNIITTELIESKAKKAKLNFEKAGVSSIINVRIGDAMQTLKDHYKPIDLLLLDGWKDLYLPLFKMLEPNFHNNTIVYVDNADMSDTKAFLNVVQLNPNYNLQELYNGKVVLITLDKKQ